MKLVCEVCACEYTNSLKRIGKFLFCSRACKESDTANQLRFWSYVQKRDECWEWIGGKARGGYGKFVFRGRLCVAHRVSWERTNGSVPKGLQLDHLCRNRACVNPAHLEPVTCRENLMRGQTLQAANVRKTHCPQGHEYSVTNTYRYPDGRRRCIECRRVADLNPRAAVRRRDYKRSVRAAASKGAA